MISLLVSWLVISLAVYVVAAVLPGMTLRKPSDAVIVAAMLGILNALIGWLLFVVIGIVTLGVGFLLAFVTRWIVNAIILMLVATWTHRLEVSGFGTALLAAFLMSLVGTVADTGIRALFFSP